MDNKKKAKELAAKLGHHEEVSEELAAKLRDANGNPLRDADSKPFFAKPGIIRKARILDDMEKRCPYTGQDIEFVHLVYPHPKFGKADKDHIIPRSKRLSDALEAQVMTFSEINLAKGQRTALQFIRDMNLPENRQYKDRFNIKTEAQFRRDVDALWPKSDPFKRARAGGQKPTDDEARCWRRKQFLLKETWDEKEFTPADLTKTRHIVKLAAQQLDSAFLELPQEQRPPVIPLIGAVTAAFRDKSWKLIGELAAVNPAVKETLEKGAKDWDAGKNFNPKKAVRGITHLHHALDAMTLGLVTNLLVPPGYHSLDGELARLIVKGKLTVDHEKNLDELTTFRSLCARLRLPRFASIDSKNRLFIEQLPEPIKKQIRERLAEKRVVQHIPARMDGLPVDLNMWRFKGWKPDGKAILEKHSRDASGNRKLDKPKAGADNKDRLIGLKPENGDGKLKQLKAVLITNENFGVALDPEPKVIPYHKVGVQIYKGFDGEKSLIERNGGKMPRIMRNGQIINVAGGRFKGTWRITSVKNKPNGVNVNLGQPDTVRTEVEVADPETGEKKRVVRPDCKHEVSLASLLKAGLTFDRTPLTGIPSSASAPAG